MITMFMSVVVRMLMIVMIMLMFVVMMVMMCMFIAVMFMVVIMIVFMVMFVAMLFTRLSDCYMVIRLTASASSAHF